jgi:hypothetical protein
MLCVKVYRQLSSLLIVDSRPPRSFVVFLIIVIHVLLQKLENEIKTEFGEHSLGNSGHEGNIP